MDRSQLRELALDYSRGEIDAAEYRRKRGNLIDEVTERRQQIIRTPATAPVNAPTPVRVDIDSGQAAGQGNTLRPAFIVVGITVLAAIVWLVYPTKHSRGPTLTPPPNLTHQTELAGDKDAMAPGPGEHLIGEFLSSPDWSEPGLTKLSAAWQALTDIEKAEAIQSGGVDALTRAIRTELDVQHKIYELSPSGSARHNIQNLSYLIQTIGLSDEFAELVVPVHVGDVSATPEPTMDEQTKQLVPTDDEPDAAMLDATASEPVAAGRVDALLPSDTQSAATQPDWLDSAPVNGFAVQLFALSSAQAAQKVIDSHPTLALKRIHLPGTSVGHRVMLSTFDSYAQALSAYQALPAAIAQTSSPPIRSIQTLRAQRADSRTTSVENLEKNRRWLASQEPRSFSLQLFAISDDRRVDRLVSENPQLDLKIHFSADREARFRILFGAFDSPELALDAFDSLPADIRALSTQPIVTRFEELQDTVVAAN